MSRLCRVATDGLSAKSYYAVAYRNVENIQASRDSSRRLVPGSFFCIDAYIRIISSEEWSIVTRRCDAHIRHLYPPTLLRILSSRKCNLAKMDASYCCNEIEFVGESEWNLFFSFSGSIARRLTRSPGNFCRVSQGKPIKREQWIVCTNRRAKCVYAACPSRYDPGRICKSVRVKLMSLPREFSSTILV